MTGMGANFIHQIDAEDAWNILCIDPGAALVDVRREDELKKDGQPDVDEVNGTIWHIEWRCDRLLAINSHFVQEVERALDASHATHLIFYCDDGRRALNAARVVAGTFEKTARPIDVSSIWPASDPDHSDCWRAAGLPWQDPAT